MESAPQPRTTIRDIAKALGLSRAAISLGLRNSPQIAVATCQKIQAAAAAMGYHPNLSATNLAHFRHSSSEKTVHSAMAWINCWKDPADLRKFHQFDLYWRSARDTAESAGYRLEEFVVDATSNVARLQNILLTRNIHGIIIPPQRRTAIGRDSAMELSIGAASPLYASGTRCDRHRFRRCTGSGGQLHAGRRGNLVARL